MFSKNRRVSEKGLRQVLITFYQNLAQSLHDVEQRR